MKLVEERFRRSVICRVLGYPISYAIVKMLLEKGEIDLETIAACVQRTKATVCSHLTKLRLANIVRYEKSGRSTSYRIKYPKEAKGILDACEVLVRRISIRLNKDV